MSEAAPSNGHRTEPVPQARLADLLEEIAGLVEHYVCLPRAALNVLIACWIAVTYCHERFQYCGYLALRSPTPRCGKTRLLKIIAMHAHGEPPITTDPTAAVLFRCRRRVLILDEIDRLRSQDRKTFGQVMAVLNQGFEKGGIVERTEKGPGGEFHVVQFPVYGPKALSGIERLTDTLADRAFTIHMKRSRHRMPRLNARRLRDKAETIRIALANWMARCAPSVEQ